MSADSDLSPEENFSENTLKKVSFEMMTQQNQSLLQIKDEGKTIESDQDEDSEESFDQFKRLPSYPTQTQIFIGGSKKPKPPFKNLSDVEKLENDILGLRSVINDRILEMAKGGTDSINELPIELDPSLPNINLAELMLGDDSSLVSKEKKTMNMLSTLM